MQVSSLMSVLFLCQKSKEKKQIGLLRKRALPSLQCDPGTEHTSIQGRIPETRKSGMPKIKNHADLFELTNNPQHV